MSNIIVIGAGITGVTTAYQLSELGHDVTVIDRQRYPAMETSFANGGQLSASNAEVWNHWSTMLKGMKWILRRDAPLLLNPAPTWHKYSWLGEFSSYARDYRDNTIETVKLAIGARQCLFSMAEREGIQFDHVARGILHFYWNRPDFEHALKVNRILIEAGLDRRPVTAEEAISIEPALHGDLYGGFHTPSDSTGDIHKFTTGLARACQRRGVRFVFDATLRSIEQSRRLRVSYTTQPPADDDMIEADAVVVCAGAASRGIAAMLGDRVNIYPVKGYSITVHLDDDASQAAAPWVSLLDDRAKIVTSRLGDDRFRVAGTAEINGMNCDIRHDRVKPLIDWTRSLFPAINTSRVISWAGLRPMMPNMMPRIGKGRRKGIFYNTGHGHLGWTLSAATAQMIAAMVSAEYA